MRMLFEGFFKQNKEESGKFERHGKLDGVEGAFGPMGVIRPARSCRHILPTTAIDL